MLPSAQTRKRNTVPTVISRFDVAIIGAGTAGLLSYRKARAAGAGAEHLAHLLASALQNRMTPARMLEMPFFHPVIEEGLRAALYDLEAKLRAARADVSKAA